MKKFLELMFILFIFAVVAIYREEINAFIVDNIIHKKEAFISSPNDYTVDYNYRYVKKTDSFIATDEQQLLDIFYTYLNNGEDEFYFYCDYDNCTSDINKFTNEQNFVNINNFVHPYNSYNKLYISTTSWGKVNVKVIKTYSEEEINLINQEINKIIEEILTDDMTDKEKIEAFHNYIINNTRYDVDYIDNNINDLNHSSNKASGPLLYSKALCGGYSHVMSVFLNIIKVPNYRVSSETHIWNYVYLDNNWYHLDLTWDDPVTSNKSDVLLDKYFLIDTETLESFNTGVHTYNKDVFGEIKTNP